MQCQTYSPCTYNDVICLNGGTCVNEPSDATNCSCVNGFTGDLCETPGPQSSSTGLTSTQLIAVVATSAVVGSVAVFGGAAAVLYAYYGGQTIQYSAGLYVAGDGSYTWRGTGRQ